MVIAHNISAMNANRQYGIVTSSKTKSMEKLSSGYKINRAADDAAGLTISEKMRSQIRGLNQGAKNIQDGISLVQIADGALAEVNDMLHRMTELSIKSANGTNTSADRNAIQKEVNQIIMEIDRIHESTEFNTMPLFDGEVKKEKGKLGGLVKCEAAETGHLTQSWRTTDGNEHPAAILDFSSINSNNISKLSEDGGKSFTFNCSNACNEEFKFTFIDDADSSRTSKITTPNEKLKHYYEINIHGKTSGKQILDELFSAVQNSVDDGTLELNGTKNAGITDGIAIGHANAIVRDGNTKLVVYSYRTNKDYFVDHPNDRFGRVDASEITGQPVEVDQMKPFWIHASSNPKDGMQIEIEKMNAEYIGVKDIDVSTEEGAKSAIDVINAAGLQISGMRSDMGAYQNRLEHAYNNNNNIAENTTAAESRIRDTDMASEMTRFTLQSILAQAGESMMSQANQSTQGVLSLLQG